jgi:hypothetical protein
MVAPQLLVISPVRNESAHIERVARAVAAQELRPTAWIVVDDGSTDRTVELLRPFQAELPFLTVVATASAPGVDPLAEGAAPRAFNAGLERAAGSTFTHIMKLDGDVELPPTYLRELLACFDADPQLGIACGDLLEESPGGLRRIAIPPHHVHGALKCYTRACFESIGGIQERLGWDTIDETYARMHGFRTRSFRQITALHHRPLGSATGRLRGRARHGECAYIAHFGLLWVSLRSVKIARQKPIGLSGLAFLFGYVRAAARRVERVPDPSFRAFARRELRRRLIRISRAAG